MNVKRYFARTAREAMSRVRAELGEDAIVLKNRPVDGGVEILALAESDLAADGHAAAAQPRAYDDEPAAAPARGTAGAAGAGPGSEAASAARTPAAGDLERAPAMSTVNFENYVRERQQRRIAAAVQDVHEDVNPAARAVAREDFDAPGVHVAAGFAPVAQTSSSLQPSSTAPAFADDRLDASSLMNELREMRGALSDQLESLSWFEGVRRRPGQSRMLRRLLQAGFSPSLSRTLANHLPADFGEGEAERWLREALVRNLRIDSPEHTIFDAGGTYALLGPTGVGKTTTAAKIAAQFALKHGAQSVGLITADVYRIGAQDQLRTFGRLLGVPVHVAHDVSTLADFLQMYMNRKLVLIDTAGVAQRDERVGELLAALSSAQVRKVLVLNAASQAEAIDETIEAYQGRSAAGVVLSKVDEAVRLGGALDCLIRHRLTLQGVANGQRVPEDWHRPEPRMLVERALATESSRASTSFSFEEAELAMLLAAGHSTAAQRAREAQRV
ncbi:MAG: flagellar biosynthesis protein FlhF [Burkholderiaceae bacterium]|nr:flagellar biosynthesis protein FlhF [Burkholderiaceae bacterium]